MVPAAGDQGQPDQDEQHAADPGDPLAVAADEPEDPQQLAEEEAEGDEDGVRGRAVAGANGFQEGVSVWGSSFQLDGDGCEEEDLYGCAGGVP